MEYVKFIVCTPEARSVSPTFPWEHLSNPELINVAKQGKLAASFGGSPQPHRQPRPGSRLLDLATEQRCATASPRIPQLPGVGEPVRRAGSAMACYARGR